MADSADFKNQYEQLLKRANTLLNDPSSVTVAADVQNETNQLNTLLTQVTAAAASAADLKALQAHIQTTLNCLNSFPNAASAFREHRKLFYQESWSVGAAF